MVSDMDLSNKQKLKEVEEALDYSPLERALLKLIKIQGGDFSMDYIRYMAKTLEQDPVFSAEEIKRRFTQIQIQIQNGVK